MITRTGYIVSCISYVVFMALDWLRPDLFQFSPPHLFLLSAIIFGILWAHRSNLNLQTPLPTSNLYSLFSF